MAASGGKRVARHPMLQLARFHWRPIEGAE